MEDFDIKRVVMFCDEGMIFAQGLMDEADDWDEYSRAASLFRSFYGIKMEYQEKKSWKKQKK